VYDVLWTCKINSILISTHKALDLLVLVENQLEGIFPLVRLDLIDLQVLSHLNS